MYRLRIKLSKTGPLRFISHLEWGKAIERACRRAGLPLALTKGFSPRAKISFGPALGVGISSEAEYTDIYLTERLPAHQVISRLNQSLPPGIRVGEAEYVPVRAPSLAAIMKAAQYEVVVELAQQMSPNQLAGLLVDFMKQKRLKVQKHNRTREVDLSQAVKLARVKKVKGKRATFGLVLATGDSSSLRPEAFVEALLAPPAVGLSKSGIISRIVSIYRLNLYSQGRLSELESSCL